MDIAVIGLSHVTAPVEVREKVSFTDSKKMEIIDILLEKSSKELVIVSTCNRSELYIAAKNIENAIEDVHELLNTILGQEAKSYLYIETGEEAIKHLFDVAAGLKSIVIGEDQILGQVKDAHAFAMEIGASGKVLNKLFREAITCGKLIRSELKISEYPLSISYIGIKFLKERLGTLADKKILVLGAGKMSKLSLKYLALEEPEVIYIANRTFCKASDLADEIDKAIPVGFDKRYELLQEVDVVITSTASPHLVLLKEQMPHLNKPLTILDIAMPRDVESQVATLEDVSLYDVDDLQDISDKNSAKREELAEEAAKITRSYVEEFITWLKMTKIDPTIQSLNEKCQEIHRDSMHYIENKLDLTSREHKIIDKMMMASLKRLIREPVKALKEMDDTTKQEAYMSMLQELFDL
ncbi:glutamyl-tRNA reductase [Niameybacter massiliensis]|uniref:glutamyl-tRNA reductase n=1 Tax=Niameybacter massiliensis TaxID=1658108 RepID=UPI0006B67830|nr:glutamyl-tRNA reductase [Niameybacter massiliensis]